MRDALAAAKQVVKDPAATRTAGDRCASTSSLLRAMVSPRRIAAKSLTSRSPVSRSLGKTRSLTSSRRTLLPLPPRVSAVAAVAAVVVVSRRGWRRSGYLAQAPCLT